MDTTATLLRSKQVKITYHSAAEKYSAALIQIFNDGLSHQERLIDLKFFNSEHSAQAWAKSHLNS